MAMDIRHLWPQHDLEQSREHTKGIGTNALEAKAFTGLVSWNEGIFSRGLTYEGYEVQAVLLPACGKNAPHRGIEYCFEPTPTSRDYTRSSESLEKAGLRDWSNSLPDSFHQPGKSSQLNPQFVAEMMGFPPDWTVLTFPKWRNESIKAYGKCHSSTSST